MNKQEVRDAWNDVSETYAQRRDPDGSDAALIDDLLDRLPADPAVLDIGCGDGARTLANLPAGSVGIDIAEEGLGLARDTVPESRLMQGDTERLPAADDQFDGVTAYHVIFHLPRGRHPAVYQEFARVLRPGGWMLATLSGGRFETVRRGWMGGRMFFSSPGREQTLDALREAGFVDIETATATDPLGSSTEFVFARRGE